MRKLIVAEYLSLDGVMQAPGGPEEDPSGEFKLGGWEAVYDEEANGPFLAELFKQKYELLLGRRTYDIWAGYWPTVKSETPGAGPIADHFNKTAKHVATHQPKTLSWKNSHALTGDIPAAVRALLKTDGPDLHTWGSANLIQQLLAAGLVDEMWLMIYPIVLGKGKRLFDGTSAPSSFKLTHGVVTKSGILLTRYARAGAVRTGTHGG
jgi:dihydrofolate reductase